MEGAGPLGNKHLLCRALRHAVRQRELQVLGNELLDVRAADIGSLLEFDNLEDLMFGKNDRQLTGARRWGGENEEADMGREEEEHMGGTHVDRPEPGSMPGGHILVESLDGVGAGQFTVFLVHVVGTTARVITDPDTEVLNFQGSLLVDL